MIYLVIIEFVVPIPLAIRWNWSALNGVIGAKSDAQNRSVQYWDRPEHRVRYTDYMTMTMRLVASSVTALGVAAATIMLHAALADNPAGATPGWVFPVALVAFLAAVAASLTPRFRMRAESRRASDQ